MKYPTYPQGEEPFIDPSIEEPNFDEPDDIDESEPANFGDPILWLFIIVILMTMAVYLTT